MRSASSSSRTTPPGTRGNGGSTHAVRTSTFGRDGAISTSAPAFMRAVAATLRSTASAIPPSGSLSGADPKNSCPGSSGCWRS